MCGSIGSKTLELNLKLNLLLWFVCLMLTLIHPPQAKELPTFKDNDFLNEGQKLQIGDDNKKYFLEKLKRDVEVRRVSVCEDVDTQYNQPT